MKIARNCSAFWRGFFFENNYLKIGYRFKIKARRRSAQDKLVGNCKTLGT
jgi:hypothetical protein